MRRLLPLLLVACAGAPPRPAGGPRGLRATEHLDVARQHDDLARQATHAPDPGSANTSVPWTWSWNAGAEHERLAAVHRSRAAALQAAYEEACGERAVEEVAVSPLQRYAIGGSNTAEGVMVQLSPAAGTADHLLADIKCHRAWMMLAPSGMDDCPLDLPGIYLDARGDANAITITISIHDPKLVPELQRRAAHELESSMQLHGAGTN